MKRFLSLLLALLVTLASLQMATLADNTGPHDFTVSSDGTERPVSYLGGQYYVVVVPSATTVVELTQTSTGFPDGIVNYNSYTYISTPSKSDYFEYEIECGPWEGGSFDQGSNTFIIPLTGAQDGAADAESKGLPTSVTYKKIVLENQYAQASYLRLAFLLVQIGEGIVENTPPTFSGLASFSKTLYLAYDEEYTIDLTNVFKDAQNDTLTYKCSADGETYTTFDGITYTGTFSGTPSTLYFKANDGQSDSTDIYTVYLESKVDKSALSSAISAAAAKVPNVANDNDYYHENDRYTGTYYLTSDTSLWSVFTSALNAANTVYNNGSATPSDVEAATSNLTAAIANLIPKTQVNATELYELANAEYVWWGNTPILKTPTTNSEAVNASTTGGASWAAYQAAKTAAQEELAKLFDENGEATAYNSTAEGSEAPANVAAAISALNAAVAGLERRADESGLANALMAWDGLDKLANKIFNPAVLIEANYTADSWSAYTTARTAALAFLRGHDEPAADAGVGETAEYVNMYNAFWSACFEGLAGSEANAAVTLSILDNHALLKGGTPSEGAGIYELSLPSGAVTLGDALTAALGEGYSLERQGADDYGVGVYINGIYVFNMTLNTAAASPASQGYESIQLHDGDTVVVALMKIPMSTNMSGSSVPKSSGDVIEDVRYLRVTSGGSTVSEVEVEAGQTLSLGVDYMFALPSGYNGGRLPLSDASVWLSDCFATKDEARAASAAINTGLVTGTDGSFELKLYSSTSGKEGWYVLNLLSGDDNSGLANGVNVLVHVTDPSSLSGIVSDLKTQLSSLRNAYEDEFYTEAQLTQVSSLFETGNMGITAALTSGEAYAAFKTAYDGIAAIQEANAEDTAKNLSNARWLMANLPSLSDTKAGKLYVNDKLWLDALFGDGGVYSKITAYQLALLTVNESTLLVALKEAYAATDNGATLESTPSYKINLVYKDADTGDSLTEEAVGVSIWSQYTEAEEIYDLDNHQVTNDNNGETVYDAASGVPAGQFIPLTIMLNGDYKLISTEDDIDEHYLTGAEGWEAKFVRTDTSLRIAMYMPRQDITITLLVSQNTPETSADTAIAELTAVYKTYNKSDYTTANWNTLVDAYNTGVENINAAANEDGITAAKQSAVDAMAAVAKKSTDTSSGISGWGSGDAFNAGEQVGTVSITVENTTFPGGDFTGTILSNASYALGENDSMMTVALRALADAGYGWTGTGGTKASGIGDFTIEYLASITIGDMALGEFSGDPGSGWMGTLNDFFVNEGLNQFKVSNGKLEDGDEIRIVYTQNLGADVGGSWGNSDTTLSALTVSTGTLTPALKTGVTSGKTYEYALVISGSSAAVKITPSAANKNYLVKAFLNEKVTTNTEGSSYYKRTESIPVTVGDTIYIGVGEYAWPSMNNQKTEARDYTGTWYELHVISPSKGSSYISTVIASLPIASKITYSNYKSYRNAIEYARTIYTVLTSSEQAKVTNYTLLTAVEARLKFFDDIQAVKTLLAAIPSKPSNSDITAIKAVRTTYDALTDAQKGYITVADVTKYNNAVEWMEDQGYESPGTITGSDKEPSSSTVITPKVTASGGKATVNLAASDLSDAIKEAKESGGAIIVTPVITGAASKVAVELPKASVSSIASETSADLSIETTVGSVRLPNAALSSIASQATGGTVTVNLGTIDSASLTETQRTAVGENQVYDISILSGITRISSFGGAGLTISLPYTLKENENPSNVAVWYLNDAGQLSQMSCTYDKTTGLASFTTTHLSYYVVGYDSWTNPYTDVKTKDWFFEAVKYVNKNSLMSGTTETSFAPNTAMTRAMLVTVLYRLDGKPAVKGVNTFTDVLSGEWYTDAVIWASSKGIVSGYSSGSFGTNDSVTRQQIAVILYRYAKYKGYSVTKTAKLNTYTDSASISDWAAEGMSWANAEGLITGVTGTTLAPTSGATRAQVATILMRFIENTVK